MLDRLLKGCAISAAGIVLLMLPESAWGQAGRLSAADLVRRGIAAQGGNAVLRSVRTIEWHAAGYRNELEQSERPEGPYFTEFDDVTELHDVAGRRIASTVRASITPFPPFTQGMVADPAAAMAVTNGVAAAGSRALLGIARETLALSPERLLLTALAAPGLRREPDVTLHDIRHGVVSFDLDGAPVRVFFNGYTDLPTAVEYSGPLARSGYWRFLGDVTMRTTFGLWWLAKTGIRLPLQITVTRNGLPDSGLSLTSIKVNDRLDETRFLISPDVRAKFAMTEPRTLDDLPLGNGGIGVEVAPGVVIYEGAWNVTLVRQDDGVVVLEAPIASGYSERVLAEAARRFPGLPVKAVVTTSDSWPHLAGIRPYSSRGVPIYCLDLNEPVLRRVIAAPYSSRPDRQERSPRSPVFRPVSTRTVLGDGDNRLELYPLRGATSERQMMVWFPGRRLLYGSDPFQRLSDGRFVYAQTVGELTAAVDRERLKPETFFMMHVSPAPWHDLDGVAARAALSNSPGD